MTGNFKLRRNTDLAKEIFDGLPDDFGRRSYKYSVGEDFAYSVEKIEVKNERPKRELAMPAGKYVTVISPKSLSKLTYRQALVLSDIISDELNNLCDPLCDGVTVIGMGNREMTVDSLGVRCAEMISPSRSAGRRGVCVLIPGVEGSTGVSALEFVSSIVNTVKPSLCVVIDSLAARSTERLGTTVQLSNSGISPGSGLGKRNIRLDSDSLGIPVVSIGVPTVISASTLISDLAGNNEIRNSNDFYVGMIESDAVIESSARIIATAIEKAFHVH